MKWRKYWCESLVLFWSEANLSSSLSISTIFVMNFKKQIKEHEKNLIIYEDEVSIIPS